jgi:hypothetical protein
MKTIPKKGKEGKFTQLFYEITTSFILRGSEGNHSIIPLSNIDAKILKRS